MRYIALLFLLLGTPAWAVPCSDQSSYAKQIGCTDPLNIRAVSDDAMATHTISYRQDTIPSLHTRIVSVAAAQIADLDRHPVTLIPAPKTGTEITFPHFNDDPHFVGPQPVMQMRSQKKPLGIEIIVPYYIVEVK